MKKLLALAALSLFASCSDITYDPETRLVFKSHLTDSHGNPAVNVRAELRVQEGDGHDLLSVAYSNQHGDVTMVFPKAENDALYSVEFARVSPDYETVALYNMRREMFADDYTYSVDKIVDNIGATVMLHLLYQQVNDNNELVSSSVTGNRGSENIDYADDLVLPYEEFVKLYKNQTVTLHYSIRDLTTDVVTDYDQEIEIAQTNIDFTVVY